MKPREIVQVSVVVRDIDTSMEQYWKILGIGPWDVYTFNQDRVREFMLYGQPVKEPFSFFLALAHCGSMQFELIQPVSGPSLYESFLKTKGEGLHHIKAEVREDEMAHTIEEFGQEGIEVILSGTFQDDIFSYFDTESTLGLVYEIGNCGAIPPPDRQYPPEAVR